MEASEETMEAAAEEKPGTWLPYKQYLDRHFHPTEEPMETESSPSKSDPPAAPVAEADAAPK